MLVAGAFGLRFLLAMVLHSASAEPAVQSSVVALRADSVLICQARQHGGYVFYVRHAEREPKQDRLTTRGISQARAWGQGVRRMQIVSARDIVVADTRRTRDTAAQTWGDSVRIDPQLNEVYRLEQERELAPEEQAGDSARVAHLRQLLLAGLRPGGNLLIVGSTNIYQRATGYPSLLQMQMAVLKPDGQGHLVELCRLTAEDLERLH